MDQTPGYQYVYRVVAGVEVTDVALPQATTQLSEEDMKKIQEALSLAKTLEDKKLWRRAATVYTSTLGMATTANELWLLAKMRNRWPAHLHSGVVWWRAGRWP